MSEEPDWVLFACLSFWIGLETPWWQRPLKPLLWLYLVHKALVDLVRAEEEVRVVEALMAPATGHLVLKLSVRGMRPDQEEQSKARVLSVVRTHLHARGLATAGMNALM